MDNIVRTAVVAAVAAAVAAAATAWAVETRAPTDDHDATHDIGLPAEGPPARVPMGDLAGAAAASLPGNLENPLDHDAAAATEGHRLYERMNCAGCHGYEAKGGMGPDLTDAHWRYGGTPVQIYKSIYEGRPEGMPAWGHALPNKSVWQLTSFIESLGGAFPADKYHAAMQGDLGDKDSGKQGGEGIK